MRIQNIRTMDKVTTYFKEHTELNGATPSTGDITCYDGVIIDPSGKEEPYESQSITISDCHSRVRLHRGSYDTDEDWLRKVQTMHDALGRYRKHLEQKMEKV